MTAKCQGMKCNFRFITLAIVAILVNTYVQANDNADSSLTKLTKRVDTLSKNTDTIKIRLDSTVKALSVNDYVDESSVDSAKKNPKELIYKTPFIKNKCCNVPTNTCISKDAAWRFWLCMALLVAFLYAALWYIANSNICKDPAFDTNGVAKTSNLTYSFSRTQLWWWTVIIISSFIFIYGDTGVLVPFNTTVVILLGLGIGTNLLGRVIDKSQTDRLPNGTRQQDAFKSQGFLTDILSDDNGISIHRFQTFVFNIVFGIAFIFFFINSVNNCKYPFIDFSEWQLTLLGISSSAYLVMKSNSENTKAVTSADATSSDAELFKRDTNNFKKD